MQQKKSCLLILSICVMIFLSWEYIHLERIQIKVAISPVINDESDWNISNGKPINTSLKYYYYDNETYFPSLEYFKTCDTVAWSKNSPEQFFLKQLTNNNSIQSQYRVYDCFTADIYVIPVSFGNARRNACRNRTEFEELLLKLPKEIFGNPYSCWNINIKSRKYHYLNAGGLAGREALIKIPNKDIWGQLIIGDQAMIPGDVMIRYNYNNNKTIKDEPCWICYGYTTVVNSLLLSTKHMPILSKILILNQTDIDREKKLNHLDIKGAKHFDQLPSINYRNKITFTDRKYGTFFIGQAFGHGYYKWRAKGVKTAYERRDIEKNYNVWITTPSTPEVAADHNWFNGCLFDSDYNLKDNISFPCHIDSRSQMMYFHLLANSKFNLMFRGGDACSSRFYDALSLDVINIVISDSFVRDCLIGNVYNEVNGLNGSIPWNRMFLQIKTNVYWKNPIKAIQNVINHNDGYFEKMIEIIDEYKKHILWDRSDSQAAMYIMKKAINKCYH